MVTFLCTRIELYTKLEGDMIWYSNSNDQQVSDEIYSRREPNQFSKRWSRSRILRMEMGHAWRSHWAGRLWSYSVNVFAKKNWFLFLDLDLDLYQAVDYKRPTYEEVMKTFQPYLESGKATKCYSTKWWKMHQVWFAAFLSSSSSSSFSSLSRICYNDYSIWTHCKCIWGLNFQIRWLFLIKWFLKNLMLLLDFIFTGARCIGFVCVAHLQKPF